MRHEAGIFAKDLPPLVPLYQTRASLRAARFLVAFVELFGFLTYSPTSLPNLANCRKGASFTRWLQPLHVIHGAGWTNRSRSSNHAASLRAASIC